MAVLLRDRDFLQPKTIHDLRSLPAEVIERYGFRYPSLRRSSTAEPSAAHYADEATSLPATSLPAGDSPGGTPRDAPLAIALQEPGAESLRALLAREPHRSLAADRQVRALQESLQATPGRLAAYLELASAYGARRAHRAAWDIVRAAADNRSPWLLLDLPLDVAPLATPATESVGARLLLADLPLEADYARRWLRGTLENCL